jgi:hypothetical protein
VIRAPLVLLAVVVLVASAATAQAWLIGKVAVALTPCATNLVFDYSDATGCNLINYAVFKL